jgi:hypothetical protein
VAHRMKLFLSYLTERSCFCLMAHKMKLFLLYSSQIEADSGGWSKNEAFKKAGTHCVATQCHARRRHLLR